MTLYDSDPARRRVATIALGVLLASAGILASGGRPASAYAPPGFSTFTASASAAPIALGFNDSGAPVIPGGQVLYATPAFSRAELDSVGDSTGFAAAPFPGDAIPALMGAANGASPTGPVFPAYPFSVVSRYPGEPEVTQSNGPQTLKATSSENSSDGDAHMGLARGNPGIASVSSTSAVKHDPGTGAVIARADGVIDGLAVQPNLVIDHVSGHAEITARPGQPIVKQTSFSVGTMTVGGQTVGFTDKGFVPADGSKSGVDANALNKQLGDAGVTLAFVPATETANSVDSAGLAIGYTREVPNVGIMKVTLTLGRVTAKVEATGDSTPVETIEYTETENVNASIEPARATGVATSVSSEAASGSRAVPVASSTEPASGSGVSPESSGSYSYAPLYAPVGEAPAAGSIGAVRIAPDTRILPASPTSVSRARGGAIYLALGAGILFVLASAGISGRRGHQLSA